MKKLLYISFLLFIISCNSQDKKENDKIINKPQPVKHTIMDTEYDYKKLISSKTEYFDIKYFDEHKDEAENLIYTEKNGTNINIFGDTESGYVSNNTPKNSMFSIYKQYNSKGTIYRKWVYFRNEGGVVGIKYEFDESGKLIKEEDTDKNFKITPQDVIKYCLENNIDLFSNYTFIERFIDDKTKEGFYNINYRGKYGEKFGAKIIIQLDGNTGEIRKVICINGKHNDSIETLYDIKDEKKKSAQIYKTYQGKNYTESEWKIFEQEQYNEHLRKTGRADLIKPTETPKTENKNSFLADEDDVKPKKKGFWG